MGWSVERWRWLGVGVVTVLAGGCLLLAWVLPMFALPKPTGPFGVGTRSVHWVDPQTRRELVVQVWYPAAGAGKKLARYARWRELRAKFGYWAWIKTNSWEGARVAEGRYPVVVFGHMWGGRRGQDTFLTEELASHGYVVVAMDHPGNAALVEMADGSVVRGTMTGAVDTNRGASAAAVGAVWARELEVWVRDDEFVLDKLQDAEAETGGWLAGRLDLDRDGARVGALGHSFGGAAGMALLGKDPRVKCAVNLDGWTFGGISTRTTQPVMWVYEGNAAVRHPESGVEGELDGLDNAAVDASLMRYGGYRAFVAGTQHLDFTDQTLVSPVQRLTSTGPIAGERVRTITRGLVLGFFEETLRGKGTMPAYPEVKMERFAGR